MPVSGSASFVFAFMYCRIIVLLLMSMSMGVVAVVELLLIVLLVRKHDTFDALNICSDCCVVEKSKIMVCGKLACL